MGEEDWNLLLRGGCQAPCFSRQLNDWEVETMEHFLLKLQERRVCRDRDDKVLWTKSKDGTFSIKKKSFNHIPLHNDKARVLWHLLFSLFGVS